MHQLQATGCWHGGIHSAHAGSVQPRVPQCCQATSRPGEVANGKGSLAPHENTVKPQRLGRLAGVRCPQQRDCSAGRWGVYALTRMDGAVVGTEHVTERIAGGVIEGHRQRQGWCNREGIGDPSIIGGRWVRLELKRLLKSREAGRAAILRSMSITADPLLRFRDEFPILGTSTYLVSNSLGAMPRRVEDELQRYADQWATRGVRAWAEGWWELPVKMGNQIAPLIGADAGQVVMMPTVTQAMSSVLSALDFPANRNEVVMTALDFPSVRYAYDGLAARFGATIVEVPSDDMLGVDVERVLAAITERTRLVAISHVLFRSAFIMDAERICKHAHAMGALVALDAYHSVGVIPVDVKAIGADFLCGGVLKWLCGGPGGCFLYASPAMSAQFAPAITGWQAHAHPFAFDNDMQYANDAWRWLGGTPTVPALFAGLAGPAIIAKAGLPAIRAKSERQTAWLIAEADKRGWTVHAPRKAAERGGTVAFNTPQAAEVARALLARDIVIDFRPGAGIRVAPHFYTTNEELDACVQAIDEILETRAWTAFVGQKSTVT